MGVKQSIPVFISGEVDFRIVRIETLFCIPSPWSQRTNLCLRYPKMTFVKPSTLEIDYSVDLKIEHYKIPDNQPPLYCYDGKELRSQRQTRLVLLEGTQNPITGSLYDLKIIDSRIVPETKTYAF